MRRISGTVELVSEVQDYNDIRIMGAIEDRMMLSTSNLPQIDAVLITTFVLPNHSETGSVALHYSINFSSLVQYQLQQSGSTLTGKPVNVLVDYERLPVGVGGDDAD